MTENTTIIDQCGSSQTHSDSHPRRRQPLKMKKKQRRRRIRTRRQENQLILLIALCSSFLASLPTSCEALSSSGSRRLWRPSSHARLFATIENESTSSSAADGLSSSDTNSGSKSIDQQYRTEEEPWSSSEEFQQQVLSPPSTSQHNSYSSSSSEKNNNQEPFFARTISSSNEKNGAALQKKRNGVSVSPFASKNGVSSSSWPQPSSKNGSYLSPKKNGVAQKKKNGKNLPSSSSSSPQPLPIIPSLSSFQDDIQGRMQRDKNKNKDSRKSNNLPGLLSLIEEMNRPIDVADAPQEDVIPETIIPIEDEEKEASSIWSTVSSLFVGATNKVRNGWRRVTPFGASATSSAQNKTIPADANQTVSNNTTTTSKSSKKEEVMVARMSRKKKKQLSNLLKKVNKRTNKNLGGITARTLSGLISAVAEEVEGLNVQLHAQEDTPFWRKQIDSVSIEFTRLGFKPLHMGGPDQLIQWNENDKERQKQRTYRIKQQQEELKRELESQQQQQQQTAKMKKEKAAASSLAAIDDSYEIEDECPVDYATDEEGNTIATMSCADTAFQQIDVDNSGALDKDEIADALVLAASSMEAKQSSTASGGDSKISGAVAELGASSRKVIQGLAKQLVDLYDTNNDGVIDRSEYQHMVEDMAALRQVQKEQEQKRREQLLQEAATEKRSIWWSSAISSIFRGNGNDAEELENEVLIQQLNGDSVLDVTNSSMGEELMDMAGLSGEIPQTLGKIELENLKMDMRQVVFGAIPFVKRITPGGPLFLEPFTVKITGSFSAEDVMKSSLLDAGLRLLVSFALRRRVRSFRDLIDGAVFHGRKWKRDSVQAPLVECTELTSVEIDEKDRLVITGRAKVRASEDAPVIDNSFKLRTRIATPRNGRAIKLSDPEIAIVLECPRDWENNINTTFAKFNMKPPSKPRPIYTYIPIQSPFNKDDDTGGYYMGEDNCIKSIYVKDKCLRFELETILRPGRFLGNHYLAFTVPQRALIITVDRVKNGIRAARKRKKALQAMQKARHHDLEEKAHHAEDALAMDTLNDYRDPGVRVDELETGLKEEAQSKGFISRFVDGYLQAGAGDEKEKLTVAISDWFGRQGNSNNDVSMPDVEISSPQNGAITMIDDVTMKHITDDSEAGKENQKEA